MSIQVLISPQYCCQFSKTFFLRIEPDSKGAIQIEIEIAGERNHRTSFTQEFEWRRCGGKIESEYRATANSESFILYIGKYFMPTFAAEKHTRTFSKTKCQ